MTGFGFSLRDLANNMLRALKHGQFSKARYVPGRVSRAYPPIYRPPQRVTSERRLTQDQKSQHPLQALRPRGKVVFTSGRITLLWTGISSAEAN